MKRSSILTLALGPLLILAAIALPAVTTASPAAAIKDGVLHIENGPSPTQGREVRVLEEVWRAGGEDSDEFFGLITQVITDREGNIYLLDTRLAEVPVYSVDGERVGTLSREGDGPGETRFPGDLLFMPDGGIGLVQPFPGRIVRLDLDGTPQSTFAVAEKNGPQGGFISFNDARAWGDKLLVKGTRAHQIPNGRRQEVFLAAFDLEGHELTRFYNHEIVQDFTDFHFSDDRFYMMEYRLWATAPDGRVYTLQDPNAYAITVYGPDGKVDRVIERKYTHLERSAEEYNRIKERVEGRILNQLPEAHIEIARDEPDLAGLRSGPDGNIWAETSRSAVEQPAGILYTWDIFEPDGEFIKQVSAQVPGDGKRDLLLWTEQGAIMVTEFYPAVVALRNGGVGESGDDDEVAPMEIIYYRVAETRVES